MAQLLTLARDLKRRKARERKGRFVAEGVRTVEELLASRLTVVGALVSPTLGGTPRGAALVHALSAKGIGVEEVTAEEFDSAADTEQPQGVLAIADAPRLTLEQLPIAQDGARLLVLDGVQDPGNVGTLIRTAAALGVQAVVALPGTADLWNAKAIRSAVGAHFRIPAIHAETTELIALLAQHDVALWSTAADGAPIDAIAAPPRLAVAVGNEGAGVSGPVRAASARAVALPMAAGVESLNVAVAAGIALYALRPGTST
jgi:TrmH family RNA methyltransferase